MYKYILSLLGFVDNTSGNPRPLSTPDPAVRLRLRDEKIQIFGWPIHGYLPPEFPVIAKGAGSVGPPFLYMEGKVPAYVSYIMGDDWRFRLSEDDTPGHDVPHCQCKGGHVILRRPRPVGKPDTEGLTENEHDLNEDGAQDEAEERAHCLRMRRCQTKSARSEKQIRDMHRFEEEYMCPFTVLFGWPARGGVWVLRDGDTRPTAGDMYWQNPRVLAEEQKAIQFRRAWSVLEQQETMEDLCLMLQEAGGQFYENIEDCPEAVRLGLHEE